MEKQMADEQKKTYENLAEGEYEGRLVYVADLGMQKPYNPEEKTTHQITLAIEILGETVDVNGEQKPRMIWAKEFNTFGNLTEMGIETKLLKVFNPLAKVGEKADWQSALGKPCSVVVTHRHDKKGNIYDEIGRQISSIPAKYHDNVAPALTTDMAVGTETESDTNPAQKALFGLMKWKFENNRVSSPSKASVTEIPTKPASQPTEDVDFEDALPF